MTLKEFNDYLARMRFVDRDDLPPGQLWDEDWPSFRDNPYRYFGVCSDQHRLDIWHALERDVKRTAADHSARLVATLNQVLR